MRQMRFLIVMFLTASALSSGYIVPGAPVHAASCTRAAPAGSGTYVPLVAANNELGFRLLDDLASHGGPNTLVSPYGAATALQMVYNGSAGPTARALAHALGVGALSRAAVRGQAEHLMAALSSADPAITLQIANSLWADRTVRLRPGFVRQVGRAYGAQVATLNFSSPSAPTTINSWVACATHNTIRTIVGRIPPGTLLYLLSALYFHGRWAAPFQSSATHPGTFTTAAHTELTVPFMYERHTLPYYSDSHVQVVSLPYGTGGVSMVIILPASGISLRSVRSSLATNLPSWLARAGSANEVALSLPRFSLQKSMDLQPVLAHLGLGSLFTAGANLTPLCASARCMLTGARQKMYLQLNEQGTTASGVTGIGVGITAVTPTVEMRVDRPFFLAVRDSTTGTLLFLGQIGRP